LGEAGRGYSARSPINTVVIGYGYAGARIHVPLIRLAPQLRLHGLCSSDPAKRADIAKLPAHPYETFAQVIADPQVQLVVLATPNTLHAPQAIAAMRAGKHVVIDKPMCLTAAEADELLAVANQTGRTLTVFHNRRFDSDYLTLCHLMTTGELGDVRWLEMSWQKAGIPRTWRHSASAGGGRLIDLGAHLIDQALLLFPSPVTSVYCRMHHDHPGLDIDSHAMLTLVFARGQTAIIDTTSMSHAPKPRIVALGSKATFAKHGLDPQEAALAAGDIDAAREDPSQWGTLHTASASRSVPPIPGRWRNYYEQLGIALQNWQSATPLPVTAQSAARVVRILVAAAESASGGRAVAVNV
jgi:scyllo-inositol 2-dehydrogenase (NADP+)